jgi:hypothetical protein
VVVPDAADDELAKYVRIWDRHARYSCRRKGKTREIERKKEKNGWATNRSTLQVSNDCAQTWIEWIGIERGIIFKNLAQNSLNLAPRRRRLSKISPSEKYALFRNPQTFAVVVVVPWLVGCFFM